MGCRITCDGIATQESNTRIAEINGKNERQCIDKQANFACLESGMEEDLVVAHTLNVLSAKKQQTLESIKDASYNYGKRSSMIIRE